VYSGLMLSLTVNTLPMLLESGKVIRVIVTWWK